MGIFRGWQPSVIYDHLSATRSWPCSRTCPFDRTQTYESMPDKANIITPLQIAIAAGCVPLDGLCLTIILWGKDELSLYLFLKAVIFHKPLEWYCPCQTKMTIKSFSSTKKLRHVHVWVHWCGCVHWAVGSEEGRQKEDGGRQLAWSEGGVYLQPKDRGKRLKFCHWWTVGDRSIFPTAQLSAQSHSTQYTSARGTVYTTVSSWHTCTRRALINTSIWSQRTQKTRESWVMLSCANTRGTFHTPCSDLTPDMTSAPEVAGQATDPSGLAPDVGPKPFVLKLSTFSCSRTTPVKQKGRASAARLLQNQHLSGPNLRDILQLWSICFRPVFLLN